MSVIKGTHNQEWKKYFLAIATKFTKKGPDAKIIGAWTFDESMLKIKNWYKTHRSFNGPARFVCFTGNAVEMDINRTTKPITFGKLHTVPLLTSPQQPISINPLPIVKPGSIDWYNYYCVVDVVPGNAVILAGGFFSDCRTTIETFTQNSGKKTERFVILSLDGHVYQMKGERTSHPNAVVTLSPTEHVKSWPLPHLWR